MLQSNVKFRSDATVDDKHDGALVSYNEEKHPDGTKPGRSFAFALTHVGHCIKRTRPQLRFKTKAQFEARQQLQWGKAHELIFRLILAIPLYEALCLAYDLNLFR